MQIKEKVFITCRGDMSVGIRPQSVTIDGVFVDQHEPDDIEFVRQELEMCFTSIFDEPAYVQFEFEYDKIVKDAMNEGREP